MNESVIVREDSADLALDERLARISPTQRALVDQRLQRQPVNGHKLVATTLASLGVTHVYGVPGQPAYDTFGACAQDSIRIIGTHHQHSGALMASAHNYFAGQQKAVSIVSTGVPTANALSSVVVARPEDVLTGLTVDSDALQLGGTSQDAPKLDHSVLQRVVAALISSERPLLIIGKGTRWGAAYAELRELVDGLALPFVTSPIGRGAIPDNHSFCMNAISRVAQSQADLVLLLGARLDWTFRYGRQLASVATVIQVDIHAAKFCCKRTVKLGVHADAGCFLRELMREIGQAQRTKARARRDQAWIGALQKLRQDVLAKREAQVGNGGSLISPLRLAKEIRDALPSNAISIFDSNLTMTACERMIPAHVPVSRLTPGTSGCMRVGIPYAIAAKLTHPERPVVAILGDFAFGLSVTELETAVRHNVSVVIVIANNDGNGGSLRQRMHLPIASPERIMMSQKSLPYDRIGEVFGGGAEHVEHANDIGPALARAIASNRPACINVAVDPDADFPTD